MLKVVLVRPGATNFDEQGRIQGTLDVPLSPQGQQQVDRAIEQLAGLPIEAIYASPGCSCQQTAAALADRLGRKVKKSKGLENLDLGLWHGKLIEEVRQTQPKVYRQWQEHPETVCPPQGESLVAARARVSEAVGKLCKKHRHGTIAIVVPEPLASLIRQSLNQTVLGDLWKAECECGHWEEIDVDPEAFLAKSRGRSERQPRPAGEDASSPACLQPDPAPGLAER